MSEREKYEREALVFGSYLSGKVPSHQVLALYQNAMEKITFPENDRDTRILSFVLKNKWSLDIIDSSLALFAPSSLLRKKLFVMLAILETSTEFCDLFLPQQRSPFYFIYLLFSGVRAIVKTVAGTILLKLI